MSGRLVGVTALALATWSCGVFTSPAGRVDLTVSLSHNPLVAGDTATIHVRAFNPTRNQLRFDAGGCILMFEVRDSTDAIVAPGSVACPAILENLVLSPGDSIVRDIPWHGERTGADGTPLGDPPPPLLPAGSYRLFGLLDATGDPQRSDAVPITITAN